MDINQWELIAYLRDNHPHQRSDICYIKHLRCSRTYEWSEMCTVCLIDIPSHLILQRNILNGK